MTRSRSMQLAARVMAGLVVFLIAAIFLGEGLLSEQPITRAELSGREQLLMALLFAATAGLAAGFFRPRIGGGIAVAATLAFLGVNVFVGRATPHWPGPESWFFSLILIAGVLFLFGKPRSTS